MQLRFKRTGLICVLDNRAKPPCLLPRDALLECVPESPCFFLWASISWGKAHGLKALWDSGSLSPRPFPGLTQALEVPLLGVEKQLPLPIVIPEPRAVVAINRASRTCPVTDYSHKPPSDPRLQALSPPKHMCDKSSTDSEAIIPKRGRL